DNNFRSLKKANIYYCYKCKIGLISASELNRLLITNNGMEQRYTFKPLNITIKNIPDTNIYKFLPIANFSISPLKRLGYSVSVSDEDRHSILDNAVAMLGIRSVLTKYLKFFIITHPYNFAAIRIWESDIEYLLKRHSINNQQE
ncbi:MAG: hypothetical protein Q4D04_11820, partial [Clostridia bacterium]|nr:hypothetical protein [Clostridia bacterium]